MLESRNETVVTEAIRQVLTAHRVVLSDVVIHDMANAALAAINKRDFEYLRTIPGGLQWLYSRPLSDAEKKAKR